MIAIHGIWIPANPRVALPAGMTTCVDTYAHRERVGVRGYKWSSYFMHVP